MAPLEVEALANYASVEKTQTVFTTETLRTAVGAWCKDKESAKEIYGDIENWNTSKVENMSFLFNDWAGAPIYCSTASAFNEDISRWDVTSVTSFYRTFCFAYAFNQDISSWKTAHVTNLQNTFSHAISFNQDLSSWNTARVTTLRGIFYDARVFNYDLSKWDLEGVETFQDAFGLATSFNQSLCWNISSGANTDAMFDGTAGGCINSRCGSAEDESLLC